MKGEQAERAMTAAYAERDSMMVTTASFGVLGFQAMGTLPNIRNRSMQNVS